MIKSCLVFTAVCLIFAGAAHAQQWSSPKMMTDVPFDFVVNGTTLPAGTYLVRTFTSGKALMIQNRDEPEYVKTVSNNDIMLPLDEFNGSTGLIFVFDNGQHVLHRIRLENDNHIHDIIHGNDAVELAETR